MAIVGNKCDRYLEEKVKKKEAKEFANEIGAYFKLTSALENIGIEDLFLELGRRLLDENYLKNEKEGQKNNCKLNKEKVKKTKKKWCIFF